MSSPLEFWEFTVILLGFDKKSSEYKLYIYPNTDTLTIQGLHENKILLTHRILVYNFVNTEFLQGE
jgi:hypothetical protein